MKPLQLLVWSYECAGLNPSEAGTWTLELSESLCGAFSGLVEPLDINMVLSGAGESSESLGAFRAPRYWCGALRGVGVGPSDVPIEP